MCGQSYTFGYDANSILQVFGSKIAVILTIVTSSIVHEYLLFTGVWFFVPILTVEFAGIGSELECPLLLLLCDVVSLLLVVFYCIKPFGGRRHSNLFLLFTYCIGLGILLFCLLAEFASRLHCPIHVRLHTFSLCTCYASCSFPSSTVS